MPSLQPPAAPCALCAGADASRACQLTRLESLSTPRLLAAILGAFLFWNAGVLSESAPFRQAAAGVLAPAACHAWPAALPLGRQGIPSLCLLLLPAAPHARLPYSPSCWRAHNRQWQAAAFRPHLFACRLTGGTLGFMALSSVILLFLLYRQA